MRHYVPLEFKAEYRGKNNLALGVKEGHIESAITKCNPLMLSSDLEMVARYDGLNDSISKEIKERAQQFPQKNYKVLLNEIKNKILINPINSLAIIDERQRNLPR